VKKLFTLVLIACVAVIGCKKKPTETSKPSSSESKVEGGASLSADKKEVTVKAADKDTPIKIKLTRTPESGKKKDDLAEEKVELTATGDIKVELVGTPTFKAKEDTVDVELKIKEGHAKDKTGTAELKAGKQTTKVTVKGAE
jgi:hypothetical protein